MWGITPPVGPLPPVQVGGAPEDDPVSLLLHWTRWIVHRLHRLHR